MQRVRFTDAKVAALVAKGIDPNDRFNDGRTKPVRYRDDKERGLFIEVTPNYGAWKVQTTLRNVGSRTRTFRKTLGRTTDYTVDEARAWAARMMAQARRGELPTDEATEPTLRSLYDRYAERRNRKRQDPTHTANIQLNARTHLSDWLDLYVSKITPKMVEERHTLIGETRGPYAANHTIKQLRAVFNSMPGIANPVVGIAWFPGNDEPKAHLKEEDLPGWWRKVAEVKNPTRRCLHQLALLSGMRYGDITPARIEHVQLERRVLHIPKMNKRKGKSFDLPLSPPMVAIVEEAMGAAQGSAFLFPADSKSGHVEDWREAGILTGHAMRRTYTTLAAQLPIPQHWREILVDHAPSGMHGRYVQDAELLARLLQTQEQISNHILSQCDAGSEPILPEAVAQAT